jgi:aromatase
VSEHRTLHTLDIAAPPEVVYGLIEDVSRWPVIFGPTVHVRSLERDSTTERFQLWATVAGEVKTWTSRRVHDKARLRIDFRQERSQPPIASMGGTWEFQPLDGGGCRVLLHHDFTATDESVVEGLIEAVNVNSERELAATARVAELGHPVEDLIFTFEDVLTLPGKAADVFTFIDRADLWPDRLPHVGRVELTETKRGIQDMEMETVTSDGSSHTTRSIRLCFPNEQIVYKQLVPPALLIGHSGAWEMTERDGETVVVARHMVAIQPTAIPKILGPGKDVADASEFLRGALGANSRTTLTHAGEYAEARRTEIRQ